MIRLFNITIICLLSQVWAGEDRKPNIILIVADDLGYADVGYHGCKDIPTPHIDSIARRGVQFTHGYANAAVCSPTRAAMLTGRYQHRFGCEYHIGQFRRSPELKIGLPLEEKTIAERLKPLGYATAMFGKWHLGGEVLQDRSIMPSSRGFDKFFGVLEGASLYDDVKNRERKYRRGYALVDGEPEYLTDAFGREAVSFIKLHHKQPFFLYLPFTAPHAPRQIKPEHMEKFKHINPLIRRELVGMVYSLDQNIGRVLSTVKEVGIEGNTLVIFLSDNGGKPNDNGSLNHPLRGQKTQYYEGGIHVPFCMMWPGKIERGTKYHNPVIGMDLFPTILKLAGGEVKPDWDIHGTDLMPYLTGKNEGRPHETIFWKSNKHYAVRHKDWKLVKQGAQMELFNLAEDLSESNDLANKHPELVQQLLKKYHAWDSQNIPPSFGHHPSIGEKIERVPR